MNLNLKKKIILIAGISAILPAFTVVMLLLFQKSTLTSSIVNDIDSLARSNISQTVLGIYNQCALADEMISFQLKQSLYMGDDLLKKKGSISEIGEITQWAAINQVSKDIKMINLPKMAVGGQWLGQNKNPNSPTPFIDEVAKLTNTTCTIFQRMNEDGDMLRVATNVINDKDERAIGTFIPSKKADGSPNEVINSVLKGQIYYGTAFVVNKYYQTVYKPFRNASGKIIGMLYFGITPDNIATLKNSILKMVIGKTGYVYVIYGTGPRKGYYVISKDGKRDGENIWNAKDSDGRLFIQDIVNKMTETQPGDIKYEYYPWKNQGEDIARSKIVALIYYKNFDWIIGAGTYEEEFREAEAITIDGINSMILWTLVFSVIIVIAMVIIAFFVGGRIAKPIILASQIMDKISEGDLETAQKMLN